MFDLSEPNTLHGDRKVLCLCDCGVVYWDYRERLNCKEKGCQELSYKEFEERAKEVGYKIPKYQSAL